MKLTAKLLFLFIPPIVMIHAQSAALHQTNQTEDPVANNRTLPPYLVYRHFLAWVDQLDNTAVNSGTSDPYKFAEPFSRANLQHEHLDLLRAAAHRLDADLKDHHGRAQLVITRYRKEAKEAVSQGKPLPVAPPEIRDLERERTALLIQNYVSLRAGLGPDASAQLDQYLNYEFAPHVKLRRIAAPTAPAQVQSSN